MHMYFCVCWLPGTYVNHGSCYRATIDPTGQTKHALASPSAGYMVQIPSDALPERVAFALVDADNYAGTILPLRLVSRMAL